MLAASDAAQAHGGAGQAQGPALPDAALAAAAPLELLPPSPSRRRLRRVLSLVNLAPLWAGRASYGRRAVVSGDLGWRRPSIAWLGPSLFLLWINYIGPMAFLQSEAKYYYGLNSSIVWSVTLSARGLISMAVSPLMGALSDRWGRRPFQALKAIIMVIPLLPLAALPRENPMRGTLAFALYVMTGVSGNPFGLSFAFCSDLVLLDRTRSLNATIALTLAVSFTPAFILAPVLCNAMVKHYGYTFMWSALIAIGVINCFYSLVILPESVRVGGSSEGDTPSAMSPTYSSRSAWSVDSGTSPTRSGAPDARRCSTLNPLRYFRLLSPQGPAGPVVAALLRRICGILFCLYVAKWSSIGIALLYAELYFDWSPERAGMLGSVWGLSQLVTMHALAQFEKHCAGQDRAGREGAIAWTGLVFGLVGISILVGAVVDWPLYPGMAVGAVSMITYTALTSYAGRLVDPSMNGEVQGLIGTVIDACEVVGPLFFGALLRWSLGTPTVAQTLPTAPFVLGAVMVLFAMALQTGLPSLQVALAKRDAFKEPAAQLMRE